MIFDKNILLFSLLGISGCALFSKPATVSKWDTLNSAQQVECFPWPKPPKDLDVTAVSVVSGKGIGFLSEGRSRRGEKVRYFTPFDGELPLKVEDHVAIVSSPSHRFLGGIDWGGRTFLIFENADAKRSLELRDPESGKVVYSFQQEHPSLDHARFLSAPQGFWMIFKAEAKDEQSIEDQPSEIVYVTNGKKGSSLVTQTFPKVKINGKPVLVKTKDPKEILAVWLDTGTSSSIEKPTFKVRLLKADGTASEEQVLKIPLSEEIERWSAFSHGSLGYLAYVDGDTLVGNANLRIAAFQWEKNLAKVNWVKAKSLVNEHTADPVWLAKGKDAVVLLLKWLDGESTLAAYKVTPDDVASLGAFGVFKEGTAFLTTFPGRKSKEQLGLIRYRKGAVQEFAICRFDGL